MGLCLLWHQLVNPPGFRSVLRPAEPVEKNGLVITWVRVAAALAGQWAGMGMRLTGLG